MGWGWAVSVCAIFYFLVRAFFFAAVAAVVDAFLLALVAAFAVVFAIAFTFGAGFPFPSPALTFDALAPAAYVG